MRLCILCSCASNCLYLFLPRLGRRVSWYIVFIRLKKNMECSDYDEGENFGSRNTKCTYFIPSPDCLIAERMERKKRRFQEESQPVCETVTGNDVNCQNYLLVRLLCREESHCTCELVIALVELQPSRPLSTSLGPMLSSFHSFFACSHILLLAYT